LLALCVIISESQKRGKEQPLVRAFSWPLFLAQRVHFLRKKLCERQRSACNMR